MNIRDRSSSLPNLKLYSYLEIDPLVKESENRRITRSASSIEKIVLPVIQIPAKDQAQKKERLAIHEFKPTPVNQLVHDYKASIKGQITEKGNIGKKHTQAETSLKTTKVFYITLFIIGAILLAALVGASIVFCPPVGVALIAAIGGFALIAFAGYGSHKIIDDYFHTLKFTSEDVKDSKAAIKNLEESFKLFEDYPNRGDHTSFEEMLDECTPQSEHLSGYRISDLSHYCILFEKKTKLRLLEENEKIADQIKELKKEQNKLENEDQDTKVIKQKIAEAENFRNINNTKISGLLRARSTSLTALRQEIETLEKTLKYKCQTAKIEPLQQNPPQNGV